LYIFYDDYQDKRCDINSQFLYLAADITVGENSLSRISY